jgi:hypothetical protein
LTKNNEGIGFERDKLLTKLYKGAEEMFRSFSRLTEASKVVCG